MSSHDLHMSWTEFVYFWKFLEAFGSFWKFLEHEGKVWIWIWNWNLIWVKFELNLKVFEVFLKEYLGSPCYLIAVSGDLFLLNKDTRKFFLWCLQVSSNSSLLFNIVFWSAIRIMSFFRFPNFKLEKRHFLVYFNGPRVAHKFLILLHTDGWIVFFCFSSIYFRDAY